MDENSLGNEDKMSPAERNAVVGALELAMNLASFHTEEGCTRTYTEHLSADCTCQLETNGAELVDEVSCMLERLAGHHLDDPAA